MRITYLTVAAAFFLTAPLLAQRNFGSATATADNHVFVGQPANFYGPGAVYVYGPDGNGAWTETARLFAPDSGLRDGFGQSLAATNRHLLIGAPRRGELGSAHVYVLNRYGAWAAHARMVDPTGNPGTGFGAAVVLADGFGFVGAPGSDRVYAVSTRDGQLAVTSEIRPPLLAESRFGSALSVDGDVFLVGAPGAESGAGAVVIYRRGGTGVWVEEQVLKGPAVEGRNRAMFGFAVHTDGVKAFVGVPGYEAGLGTVMVFERQGGGGSWRETGQLTLDGGRRGSIFGMAVATMGDEVWVGAPGAEDGDGAVYRFRRGPDGTWTSHDNLRPDSAGTAAWPFGFGTSITTGSTASVIGMPTRDFGEGRAAIMTRSGDAWNETATVLGEIAKPVTAIESGTECENGSVAVFECSNIEVVSFTPVSELGGARGVWVNDVWGWSDPATGSDYALVSRRDGAAFVDLSDPANPRLVGSLPRTAGSRPTVWRDIKVVNNHAYIVSDGAGAHGMQVFDLTRLRGVTGAPVTFTEDGHYSEIHSAHNVVADTTSRFLYIVGASGGGETCGGGLHMVDARQPKNPVFAGCYNSPAEGRSNGYTHDAQCVVYRGSDTRYTGRQICIGSNAVELNIADVTDKDNPVLIGRSSYPNVAYAHQGWLDETQRYFYMGDEGDEVSGLVEGTRTLVWDLAQLDDPILIKEYIGPVRASDHNLFVRGNRVYMSNYGSGLRVLDISQPDNPREIAFFDSAPLGDNEPGMSSAVSGAWSNYPFFESGLVVFTSVREGLFVVRVKRPVLIP